MKPRVAYFSMEIALESAIPTYSGGLGVLAGDLVRSAADLGTPLVGVTLLYRRGYFRQELGRDGMQREHPVEWDPRRHFKRLRPRVSVPLEGREVRLRAWQAEVCGEGAEPVPVLLLDSDLRENSAEDRRWTDWLYGGDERTRLAQEVLLGVGGVRMLEALGMAPERYHLNEGHAALAVAALLLREAGPRARRRAFSAAQHRVREACVFTTHTPVPAGHDRFAAKLVRRMLDRGLQRALRALGCGGELNMTRLAAAGSGFVNGVSARHAQVTRRMLPGRTLHSVPNGVHPGTWVSPWLARVFERHVPGWRRDPQRLRDVSLVPASELWTAHARAKRALLRHVTRVSRVRLDPEALTLGFARRATGYKRASLLLRQPARLRALARRRGPLQILYSGKAHPRDEGGKALIREVHALAARLEPEVKLVYLPGYDMSQAALLVAGCDVWVNTPIAPLEASGTSGMKAALNGVPSLSVLDGWWLEGCVDGVTGWALGERDDGRLSEKRQEALHGALLMRRLEREVAPRFFGDRPAWIEMMRAAIMLNGSYFSSHRMLEQYARFAWGDRPRE